MVVVLEWRLRVLFNSRPAVAIQMLGSGARAVMVKCDNESIEFEQHRVDGDEYESAMTMIVMTAVVMMMMMMIASCVLPARWTTK